MYQSERRQSRVVLAPPIVNPYEEQEKVGEEDGGATEAHGQQRGGGGSKASADVEPPLAMPVAKRVTIEEDATLGREDPITRGDLALPSQEFSKASQRQSALPRVPHSRGPNSATVVMHIDVDSMNITRNEAVHVESSRSSTQHPHSSRFIPPPQHQVITRQQPSGRSLGLSEDSTHDGLMREDNRGEENPSIAIPALAPGRGQKFMAQSCFTQANPFRVQGFEAFCCSPDFSVPPDFHPVPPSNSDGWAGFQRAAEGQFCSVHHVDDPLQKSLGISSTCIAPGTALGTLQAGDWFLKWTRRGEVHERYVWLNVNLGALLWAPNPRPSPILVSQLKLSDVVDLRPDCVSDAGRQFTLYRLFFVTQERTIVMATEVRDKFDLWFPALQRMISTQNMRQQWGGLWGSPRVAATSFTKPMWVSRCSPLQAILQGDEIAPTAAASRGGYGGVHGQVLPSD